MRANGGRGRGVGFWKLSQLSTLVKSGMRAGSLAERGRPAGEFDDVDRPGWRKLDEDAAGALLDVVEDSSAFDRDEPARCHALGVPPLQRLRSNARLGYSSWG